jgi:DNA polymerase V
MPLPYASGGIRAGFPSPAQDFMGEKIDLNTIIIKNPSETFYAKVNGDSMKDAGIHDGDILVVDRSIAPEDGNIFVVYLNGEYTVKRLRIDKKSRRLWLVPENDAFEPVEVKEDDDDVIMWGRVINVIKNL